MKRKEFNEILKVLDDAQMADYEASHYEAKAYDLYKQAKIALQGKTLTKKQKEELEEYEYELAMVWEV